jgi:cyclophilin family peptidyl-prolyl cis-trans isomerase
MKFVKIILSLVFAICISHVTIAQVKKPVVKKKVVVKKSGSFKPPVIVKEPGTRIRLTTDSGVIVLRLYDKTPLHRDNFIKLVNDKFFDSLLFHRVMNSFMIQGGDPQSKTAPAGTMLGNGDVGYTIPAEFDTNYFHKKGALAAARIGDDVNPQKASSGCQFYIVQGNRYDDNSLNGIEAQMRIKFSPKKRKIYKTVGGTPFLDMNYTVFGETESGFEVIDKIAKMPGNPYNRPNTDIRMKMEIIK